MIGSTTPVAEPDSHPVHRANAMLRAALLSSAHHAELFGDPPKVEALSVAVDSVMHSPVGVSFPEPLASRLDALALDDAFPKFQSLTGDLQEAEEAADEAEEDFSDIPLIAGLPLDPAWHSSVPQDQIQTLLQEFHRRQRQASLLVAGSIATAMLLTAGGLWLAVSLALPHAVGSNGHPLPHSTSVAWQPPAGLHATVLANRDAKAAPLPLPVLTATPAPAASPAAPRAQTILATGGREFAFAALLPPSLAGYYMIRGLPAEARLSAGRQSDSGTWLVKAQHANALTLSLGAVADGDYPIEIYVLQSGDSPQSRRSVVLRVESPIRVEQASTDRNWTSTLLDLVPAAHAAEATGVPADTALLHERAGRLLAEGDIAGARLLLTYLAERGEDVAAYELGRTFDREMLAEFGAKGIAGDLDRARGWYQRAAQGGNAKATERLKILASLAGPGPSD